MAIKQISAFLENRSGRLWELCDTLGKNDINIRALSIGEAADFGIVRMIVNDPVKANQVLEDSGFMVTQTDVLAVAIPDVPGGLADVLRVLKEKEVNVEYAYAFVAQSGDMAIVSIRTESADDTAKVLLNAGLSILTAEQIYKL